MSTENLRRVRTAWIFGAASSWCRPERQTALSLASPSTWSRLLPSFFSSSSSSMGSFFCSCLELCGRNLQHVFPLEQFSGLDLVVEIPGDRFIRGFAH